MRLKLHDIVQYKVLDKFLTSSGRLNLPGIGLHEYGDVEYALAEEIIVALFEHGRIYFNIKGDYYEDIDKKGNTVKRYSTKRFDNWQESISRRNGSTSTAPDKSIEHLEFIEWAKGRIGSVEK